MRPLLLALTIVIAIPIIQSCTQDVSCNCPASSPYYDFNKVRVDGSPDVGNNTLFLEVDLVELVYLGSVKETHLSGNNLMACTCLPPGYLGLENIVTELEITSDMDFGLDFGAGKSLNELVTRFSDPSIEDLDQYIENINSSVWLSRVNMVMELEEQEVPDTEFRIFMTYKREDGSQVIGETAPITF